MRITMIAIAMLALTGCGGNDPLSNTVIGSWFFFAYMTPKPTIVCRSAANGETVTVSTTEAPRVCVPVK